MKKYIVEIANKGLLKENSVFENRTYFEVIEANTIKEVKNIIKTEYQDCLDVIYYPINIWKLGENVWTKKEEKN